MRKILKLCILFVLIYIISYFVILKRHTLAYKDVGNCRAILFASCFRWSTMSDYMIETNSNLQIKRGDVTVFNYVYYPVDELYYKIEEIFR